jgi:hypothetical protein
MGKTKSRDICPVIDARFKSPFLVVHVNFFKSLNELANKAEIEEGTIFTLEKTFKSIGYHS